MNEPGVKWDGDKRRYDLLPVEALDAIVDVYTYGARKYGDRNWEKGMSWSRVYAAVLRHLTAFWGKEDIDEDSQMLHLALAATDIQFLLDYQLKGKGKDDRP